MDIESLIKIDLDQMSEMNLYQASQEVKKESLDIIEKPSEATNPENVRKRKKRDKNGQNKPFKSSQEMNDIDSPAVKVEKEVKLELKEKTLETKKEIVYQLQTEEPMNNKVEYLYFYDNPENWKQGRCLVCENKQKETLKKRKGEVHERKKAQCKTTKR